MRALPLWHWHFTQYIVCEKANAKKHGCTIRAPLFSETRTSAIKHWTAPPDACGMPPARKRHNWFTRIFITLSYCDKEGGWKAYRCRLYHRVERVYQTSFLQPVWLDWNDQRRKNSQGKITARKCDEIIKNSAGKVLRTGTKYSSSGCRNGQEGNKLKNNEEPPPNTLFILVAENEELILPTIVSRCQLIKIPALETKGDWKRL